MFQVLTPCPHANYAAFARKDVIMIIIVPKQIQQVSNISKLIAYTPTWEPRIESILCRLQGCSDSKAKWGGQLSFYMWQTDFQRRGVWPSRWTKFKSISFQCLFGNDLLICHAYPRISLNPVTDHFARCFEEDWRSGGASLFLIHFFRWNQVLTWA